MHSCGSLSRQREHGRNKPDREYNTKRPGRHRTCSRRLMSAGDRRAKMEFGASVIPRQISHGMATRQGSRSSALGQSCYARRIDCAGGRAKTQRRARGLHQRLLRPVAPRPPALPGARARAGRPAGGGHQQRPQRAQAEGRIPAGDAAGGARGNPRGAGGGGLRRGVRRTHAARPDRASAASRAGEGRRLGPGRNRRPRRSRSRGRPRRFRAARAGLFDQRHPRTHPHFRARRPGGRAPPQSAKRSSVMFLPSVAELLARVARHPVVDRIFDALRRGAPLERLAGVTEVAKALVVAHAAAELRRPVLLLVESNERAEALAEPLRFFYRALSGKPAAHVATLPALDVLPWQNLSPHPEIQGTRAAALWRVSTGQAPVVLTPVAAALMRLRETEFYRGLACSLERDDEVPLEGLIERLSAVGYERQETVEVPGQFAVRGGIVDVFSPESARPVRLELFGDTVESQIGRAHV